MENLTGITAQRVADKMIALPGLLHFGRMRQLIEQLIIQRFTIH
ncbi:Uncharacterised protein [Enterobacter cloacae]|nr:Uncharacterised protein [Enterobacter cloacae]